VIITTFFAWVTDFYFLRRFLDKKYITNGIAYNGAIHSIHFAYILVKYFDFEITHVFASEETNMKKLNNIIKNSQYNKKLEFIFYPTSINQCINMKNFPKNLL
jgi:hypothetical protein